MQDSNDKTPPLVRAADFVASESPANEAGERVAIAVNALLQANECVQLSLVGLRGVASTFFNVLVHEVAQVHGHEAFHGRVELVFETDLQSRAFARSLAHAK